MRPIRWLRRSSVGLVAAISVALAVLLVGGRLAAWDRDLQGTFGYGRYHYWSTVGAEGIHLGLRRTHLALLIACGNPAPHWRVSCRAAQPPSPLESYCIRARPGGDSWVFPGVWMEAG